MNSKAIKRQLLAAIAMVLVAALALGSSTFAWFANNNVVEATGLNVNAQVEGTMLIINKDKDTLFDTAAGKLTTIPMELSAANLFPIHPDLTTGAFTTNSIAYADATTWVHAFSDSFTTAISNSQEETKAITYAGNVGKNGENAYLLKGGIAIGIDDTNKTARLYSLRVSDVNIKWSTSVNASETTTDLLKSARVMLVNSDNKVVGVYGYDGTNATVLTTAGNATTADTMATLAVNTNSPIMKDTLEAGKTNAQTYSVYVYFDGRDPNCTSEKFTSKGIEVTLKFTADTTAPVGP